MNLFKSKNTVKNNTTNTANLAEIALNAIHDGVVMTDRSGVIEFANPAAITMLEYGSKDQVVGLDYALVIKIETKEGRELSDMENPLIQAMRTSQPLSHYACCLIAGASKKRIPVSISVLPTGGLSQEYIITFRDITEELKEEGEQTEFVSTASHEMRTPVASIDGYISLCLNPQTATIDERARGYLTSAQAASKHLGKLFQDLLDVTRLDDGKIQPHLAPFEMVGLVKTISDDYIAQAKAAGLTYAFGSDQSAALGTGRRMEQVVYGYVDPDFMREILDNLVSNAIKYTPSGGSIYVNVRGDGDRVLINVTDTGMGISADDLTHIFQKFYRADNSDTRTIGGTGLGLYLVKQRVESMGGRVWAESAFGEGSTFYVSLPRITGDEYEKRMIAIRNQQMQQPTPQPILQPQPQPTPQPIPQFRPTSQSAPQPQPVQQSIPQPTPVQAPQAIQPTPLPTPQPNLPTPVISPPVAPPQPIQQNQNNINNNLNGDIK